MPVVHNLANYCGEKHASRAYWSSHDFACAQCHSQTNDLSLWYVPVHMCTKLENGILVNGQQLGNTVNSFIRRKKEKKKEKMALLQPHTLTFSCLLQGF